MSPSIARLTRWPGTSGESFKKAGRLSGRIGDLELIEARAESVLDAVPVTRVTDITQLDECDVPVFAAVTPLARDLTTHLGKGASARAARVSAMMEAIERVSAEQCRGRRRRASFDELRASGVNAVDPLGFDLPRSTRYRSDQPFDWVEGWELISGEPAWIPVDLAITPPKEGILDQVDTNGVAAGASYGEAMRHALLEVIERDAVSQHQFYDLFGEHGNGGPVKSRIDPDSLPVSLDGYRRRAEVMKLDLAFEDLTSELGIPTVACTMTDHTFAGHDGPAVRQFGGWGADTVAEGAIIRSATEAFQARLGYIQGSRDSFNLAPRPTRTASRAAKERDLQAVGQQDFSAVPSYESDDLAADVEHILQALFSIGIDRAFVVDLSREDLAIPVLRVRVPGLSAFVVDRQRVGWRCARHLL